MLMVEKTVIARPHDIEGRRPSPSRENQHWPIQPSSQNPISMKID
jgi:hypothetical protein